MKKTLGLKKTDLLTDSLDAFWKKSEATTIPVPQVDNTPQDIIQSPGNAIIQEQDFRGPQQEYSGYGGSIKAAVEQSSKDVQDLVPDPQAAQQMMGPTSMVMASPARPGPITQRPGNAFDIGGFDAMINNQINYERGAFGITPRAGYGGVGPMSDIERFQKKRAEYKFNTMRRASEQQLRYKQLAMGAFAQEARAKQDINRQISRTYKEATKKQRLEAGLPVYESPWDVIAGGKRVVKKYNEKGKIIGSDIERYGGLAGAYKDAAPIGRGAKKLGVKIGSSISDIYDKGYKEVSKYNQKRKMNELNKIINDETQKYTDKSSNNKYVTRAPSWGTSGENYSDDIAKSINSAMAELNNDSPKIEKKIVKDLRDV